jgi:hypothetical protein
LAQVLLWQCAPDGRIPATNSDKVVMKLFDGGENFHHATLPEFGNQMRRLPLNAMRVRRSLLALIHTTISSDSQHNLVLGLLGIIMGPLEGPRRLAQSPRDKCIKKLYPVPPWRVYYRITLAPCRLAGTLAGSPSPLCRHWNLHAWPIVRSSYSLTIHFWGRRTCPTIFISLDCGLGPGQ